MTSIPDPPRDLDDTMAVTRFFEALTLKLRGIEQGSDPSIRQAVQQVLSGTGSGSDTGSGPASPVLPGQTDTSPPPAPIGLTTNDGMGTVYLSWNNPILTYSYRVEVFEAPVDDIGQRVKVWSGVGQQAVIQKGNTDTYYYWIRFSKGIETQAITGPFNATAGTTGSAGSLVGNDQPFLFQNGKLYINSAAINNVNINALQGDMASFLTANIGEASITNAMIGGEIKSDNYVPGAAGWIIKK